MGKRHKSKMDLWLIEIATFDISVVKEEDVGVRSGSGEQVVKLWCVDKCLALFNKNCYLCI